MTKSQEYAGGQNKNWKWSWSIKEWSEKIPKNGIHINECYNM